MKIHKLQAAFVAVAGIAAIGLTSVPASATPTLGSETVSPSHHLTDGQTVTIDVSNFGTETGTVYAVECTPAVISPSPDTSYCDQTPAHVSGGEITNGSGTLTFTVHTGSNFKPTAKGAKCDPSDGCDIVVSDSTDSADIKYAAFAAISFGGSSATTIASSPKKVPAGGGTVKFTSTVKPVKTSSTKPTGKVVFTDNGKKFGSVALTSSGKVTASDKLKPGTNKIEATYAGDANFSGSHASETIKVANKK